MQIIDNFYSKLLTKMYYVEIKREVEVTKTLF